MTPQSSQWKTMLMDGAARLGFGLDDGQADLFSRHAMLLLEWNRKINLTAIVDPVEMAVKHYLDAIAPLRHIPVDGPLLDIGTGGGFPGIPLKIMRPDQPMILIDSVRKKISFVKHAIRQLCLKAIQARHIRAEELVQKSDEQHHYHAIVCRALTDLPAIVRLAAPLLAADGAIIAYKGPPKNELPDAQPPDLLPGYRTRVYSYRLPELGDQRSVLVIRKTI